MIKKTTGKSLLKGSSFAAKETAFGLGLFFLAFHCSGSQPPKPPIPVPNGEQPGQFQDPFIQRSRLEGSTFIEVAEIKTREDGTLFFCTGVQGLRIVDAKDPSNMESIATVSSSLSHPRFPRCQHVALGEETVFVTNKGDEIQPTPFVSMVTTSGTPREVSVFKKPGYSFEGIDSEGDYVYVAMHGHGVLVLRSDNNTLAEVTTFATGLTNAWSVDVLNDVLYIADGASGLVTYNVSNKTSPTLLGHIDLDGVAQSIQVIGNIAYIAAGSAGLITVDVSDPANPRILATIDTPGSALQVSVSQSIAYVADWNDVRLIDVQNPKTPKTIQSERIKTGESFSRVLGVSSLGRNAFIGEWTGMYAYEHRPSIKAPDLLISQRNLNFGKVDVGQKENQTLFIENNGDARLVAYDITTSEGFSVKQNRISLKPGESGFVEVSFEPTEDEEKSGSLRIRSDDPDETTKDVPLKANADGLGVGNQAEEVELRLLKGELWNSSAVRNKVIVLAYFATF